MSKLDTSTEIIRQQLEVERKILSLMLEHSDIVSEMYEQGVGPSFFDPVHIPIVQAIYLEHTKSNGKRLLTDEVYRHILLQQGKPKEVPQSMSIFYTVKFGELVNKNSFDFLKQSLVDSHVFKQNLISFEKFNNDIGKHGYLSATKQLCDSLSSAITTTESRKANFVTASDFKVEYLEHLKMLAEGADNVISCGLPELDDSLLSGFKAGHMTLVVGAPGSHKTNLMINLSLNINKVFKLPVLYVSLEMSKEDLTHRIISNQTGIAYAKVVRPKSLNAKENEIISNSDWWNNSSYGILDVTDGISVANLKRELEKRINIFSPKIIVVDYLSLMKPDIMYSNRHDLELGNIAKDLRGIGRSYGIHVITAAQMGRSDIRRIREQGADATLDTTSVSGSQEVPAHSDNVIALTVVPDSPNIIKLHLVKCRNGVANVTKELHVDPSCARITSTSMVAAMDGTNDSDWGMELNEPISVETINNNSLPYQEEESQSMEFDGMNLDDLE